MTETEEAKGCRRLWQAILLLMWDDARGAYYGNSVKPVVKVHIQRNAVDWFVNGGTDFRMVCWLAGLDPDALHQRALVALQAAGLLNGRRPA